MIFDYTPCIQILLWLTNNNPVIYLMEQDDSLMYSGYF